MNVVLLLLLRQQHHHHHLRANLSLKLQVAREFANKRVLYIPIRMCDGRTFARTLTQNRHRAQLNAHAQYNVNMCVCGVDFFFS